MQTESAGAPTTALLAMLLAPLLGPLFYRLARDARALLTGLDGFMLVSVSGLVIFDVLPRCVEGAGLVAVPIALVGLFAPTAFERARAALGRRVHRATLALAVAGIIVHSFIDGAGLVHDSDLTLALILHRLPVGLAVWVLLRRDRGAAVALTGVALLDISTAAGFTTAHVLAPRLDGVAMSAFAALVAGSLLHVVVHLPAESMRESDRGDRAASAAGAVLGVLLLVFVLGGHGHPEHGHGDHGLHVHGDGSSAAEIADRFLDLAAASAPALLLAYLAASLLFAYAPRAGSRWLGARSGTVGQAVRGLAFGLPLPICSCGVVPIYRALAAGGVPLAAGLSLLVSAPELGVDSIFLSVRLLGTPFALLRIAAAVVLALAVAVILGRPGGEPAGVPDRECVADARPDGLGTRLVEGLRAGFGEIVDHTAPWVLLGLAIAAFCDPLLDAGSLADLPSVVEVPLLAVAGMPLYVCASGATPLAAVLVAHGVSPGGAIAFLLTGPATNVTTFGILADLHGRRLALRFGACVGGLAVALGWTVNLLLPELGPVVSEEAHELSPLALAALALLGLVYLASVVRCGARGFVARVLAQTSAPEARRSSPHSSPCC